MTLGIVRVALLTGAVAAVYLSLGILGHLNRDGSVCEVPVVVEVLNGCGEHGIAEKVAEHLRERGFDVMYVGNAGDFDYTETLVVDRTGDRDKARMVAGALGKAPVVYQIGSVFFVDVTVVLGHDASTSSWLGSAPGNAL